MVTKIIQIEKERLDEILKPINYILGLFNHLDSKPPVEDVIELRYLQGQRKAHKQSLINLRDHFEWEKKLLLKVDLTQFAYEKEKDVKELNILIGLYGDF